MTITYAQSFAKLQRYLLDYKPQLQKALAAIQSHKSLALQQLFQQALPKIKP